MSFFFPRKPQCSLRQSRGEFKCRRETRLTFCTQHAHFLSGYSLYVVSFMLQVFNSLETSLNVKKKKKKKKKTFLTRARYSKITLPFRLLRRGYFGSRGNYHRNSACNFQLINLFKNDNFYIQNCSYS